MVNIFFILKNEFCGLHCELLRVVRSRSLHPIFVCVASRGNHYCIITQLFTFHFFTVLGQKLNKNPDLFTRGYLENPEIFQGIFPCEARYLLVGMNCNVVAHKS